MIFSYFGTVYHEILGNSAAIILWVVYVYKSFALAH